MLHYSCDLCDANCTGDITRRWEHINGMLGLEVVILKGDKPQGDVHLCDECILKMFFTMLERLPSTGLKGYKQKLDAKELELNRRVIGIEEKEESIRIMRLELDQKVRELDQKQLEFEANKDKLLRFKEFESASIIETVKRREVEAIRQAEARGKQQYIDELNAEEDRKRGRI